jgi:hypothetical protein
VILTNSAGPSKSSDEGRDKVLNRLGSSAKHVLAGQRLITS